MRDAAQLNEARSGLQALREAWGRSGVPGGPAYNLAWMDYLNLENWLDVCDAIVASALAREESRGSHYRSDFPAAAPGELYNLTLLQGEAPARRPVRFPRLQPEQAA